MSFDLSGKLPDKGVAVPVYATFTGVKGVPLWALSTNNFAPELRLFQDHLEFRVIRRHSRPYSDIQRVEILQKWKTNNIYFEWHDTRLTLSANVIRADWLLQTVQFFERRSIPLGAKAQAALQPPPISPKVN